jgi:hypothetical protein
LLGQAGAASGWTGATPATGGDPVAGHSIDALHQQQLLRQAVAGFGGEGGGSAAVWTRKLATPGADLAAVQGDAGWQGLQRRAA